MRKFLSALAASSMLFGSMQTTAIAAQPTAGAATSNTCTGPGMTWRHLGGDPFARSPAASRQGLPRALTHMVAAGCLPQGAVAGALELVRSNPNGTVTNAGPDGLVTLVNGMHFDFSESGSQPHLNVTVGLINAGGSGLVVGVQAKVWVFTYDSVTYYLYEPKICFNWSLQRVPNGPPPPPADVCYVIRTPYQVREDRSNHYGLYGPDANVDDDCFRWRYEGETEWHRYRQCPQDACTYDAVTAEVGGMRLRFKGLTTFAPPAGSREVRPPANARYVEYRVSAAFATSNENLALFCRELVTGQMSCGKMVRYDDYHDRVATIYRSLADYRAAGAIGRVLVWDFFRNPADCRRYWTH